jgi:hypothetical protein
LWGEEMEKNYENHVDKRIREIHERMRNSRLKRKCKMNLKK